MSSRSRMAAVALGWIGLVGIAPAPARAEEEAITNTVSLELRIAGLGREGCEIEVKPGHPGCSFAPVRRQVPGLVAGGIVRLKEPLRIEARTINADRDCMFAITIKEPGREPRTVRRGVRLEPPTAEHPRPAQTLTCYLSTPSLAAKDAPGAVRR